MLFILAALFVASPLQRFSRCRSHRSSRLVPLFDAPQRARVVVTVVVKCRSLRPVVDVAKEYQRRCKSDLVWFVFGNDDDDDDDDENASSCSRSLLLLGIYSRVPKRALQNKNGGEEGRKLCKFKRRGCFIQFCSSFFMFFRVLHGKSSSFLLLEEKRSGDAGQQRPDEATTNPSHHQRRRRRRRTSFFAGSSSSFLLDGAALFCLLLYRVL